MSKDLVDFDASPKVNVTINGTIHALPTGITAIQACELAGIEIPRFCYHDRLKIAGNCRMCLVEIQPGPPKPQASCAMNIAEGMVIVTNSEKVKKAREGVMEFLLANHPLDCPICDQGGECDLQDQAYQYGRSETRFDEEKRAVEPKNFGPLIKTNMTRCIHCTRCIRFVEDIAGTHEIGGFGRGNDMQVSTYLDSAVKSELSGNVIDLCPVGALTSRPYAFKGRPWELSKTESVDVLDAACSSIRIDTKGGKVYRILPSINEDINEEWISDKTRFACDGLYVQRLDKCYVRKDGKLQPSSWKEAMDAILQGLKGLKGHQIAGIAGDLADMGSIYALKQILNGLGSDYTESRQDGAKININTPQNYIFNSTIAGIEEASDLLIIGSNVRVEAPIINARIRKAVVNYGLKVAYLGPKIEGKYAINYPFEYLGNDKNTLNQILDGTHGYAKKLENSQKPMIILGQDALRGSDGLEVHNICLAIADKYLKKPEWNGFNMLHKAAGRVGAINLGFVSEVGIEGVLNKCRLGEIKFAYLLGADEVDMEYFKDTFVVYHGTHGDNGVKYADVILPAATYTEKNATYMNTEGRVRETLQASSLLEDSKNELEALNMLASELKIKLKTGFELEKPSFNSNTKFENLKGEFVLNSGNFYQTDPISRSSATMAKCVIESSEPLVY
jgi:NADH-quinone oxidoreductase subunit G